MPGCVVLAYYPTNTIPHPPASWLKMLKQKFGARVIPVQVGKLAEDVKRLETVLNRYRCGTVVLAVPAYLVPVYANAARRQNATPYTVVLNIVQARKGAKNLPPTAVPLKCSNNSCMYAVPAALQLVEKVTITGRRVPLVSA